MNKYNQLEYASSYLYCIVFAPGNLLLVYETLSEWKTILRSISILQIAPLKIAHRPVAFA